MTRIRLFGLFASAGLMALAPSVRAEEALQQEEQKEEKQIQQEECKPVSGMEQPPPPAAVPVEEEHVPWYDRVGFALIAGGGVMDQQNNDLGTNTGGDWDARLQIANELPIGGEVAYVGTAQSIDALGLDPSADLVSNGIEGNLRLNIGPAVGGLKTGTVDWNPFLYGGLAWSNYQLTNESFNTSDVQNSDNTLDVPVGGGIAGDYDHFAFDARFAYRFSYYDNMVPEQGIGNTGDESMDYWTVMGHLGYAF